MTFYTVKTVGYSCVGLPVIYPFHGLSWLKSIRLDAAAKSLYRTVKFCVLWICSFKQSATLCDISVSQNTFDRRLKPVNGFFQTVHRFGVPACQSWPTFLGYLLNLSSRVLSGLNATKFLHLTERRTVLLSKDMSRCAIVIHVYILPAVPFQL